MRRRAPMDNDVPGMAETVPITEQVAAAHECEYRATEARQTVRDWYATSDPVKRAIMEDCAKTLEWARRALSPLPSQETEE